VQLDHPLNITSQSGDSSDTWISFHNQVFHKDYVYHLKGVRHLNFKNLGFRSDRTEKYQGLVLLTDSCVDISFTGDYFLTSQSSFHKYGDLISSTDNRNTDLVIKGSNFLHGRNAININAPYLTLHNRVIISGNEFLNQSNAGVYVERASEIDIYNNRFRSVTDPEISGGMMRGVHLQNAYKGDMYKSMVYNNIFDMQAQLSGNPILLLSSDSVLVLHNTVHANVTPLSIQDCSGTIANNILHATTGNTTVNVDDTTGLVMIHNVYFIDDQYDWEVAFALMDTTSFETHPVYDDILTFTPTSPFLKNTGKYFGEAQYDINGVSRFPDPDIGGLLWGIHDSRCRGRI